MIRTKLRITAMAAMVTLGAIGISMLVAINESASLTARLYNHPYRVALVVRELQTELASMQSSLDGVVRNPSPLQLRRFYRSNVDRDRAAQDYFQTIETKSLGDPTLVLDAHAAYNEWIVIRGDVISHIRRSDLVSAYTLAKTDGAGQIAKIHTLLDLLATEADVQSASFFDQTNALKTQLILRQCLLIILAIGAGILAIRYIGSSIIRPTRDIGDAIGAIANDNLDTKIPHLDRVDEIGDIARSVEVLMAHATDIKASLIDDLTGLGTRKSIEALLDTLSPQELSHTSVLHLDIDEFRQLNDTFGRETGNKVLRQIAERLAETLDDSELLFREGADSFIVLDRSQKTPDDLIAAARNIGAAVKEPFEIAGHTIRLSCCIGIARARPNQSPRTLLINAENALFEARARGESTISVYTDALDTRLKNRRDIVKQLKFAINNDEIAPFFQPQIDARSGAITGLEALVRWHHPEHGVLSPWQFIDIAEYAGLMGQVGDIMIEKSLAQLADWRRQGLDIPKVSVNFTASDLRQPDLPDRLMMSIDRHDLEPGNLCIEVLESALIEGADDPVIKTLDRLSSLGFQIELDDFGTGHAAISNLHMIKLQGIKIDRSFVTNLSTRPAQSKLTKAMLQMAASLNIQAVAEGIETQTDQQYLTSLGATSLQGYHISRPMPSDQATQWILDYRQTHLRRVAG